MTNSPPLNVVGGQSDFRPLLSGMDGLTLSLYVKWKDQSLFDALELGRKQAAFLKRDYPFKLHPKTGEEWIFDIKSHGSRGYAWLLNNREYQLSVGDWLELKTIPNVKIRVLSETLWRLGVQDSVERVLGLLESFTEAVCGLKVSRVDLCVDGLIPESMWDGSLADYCVTRSTSFDPHYRWGRLTGFSWGKGDISARMYDKPEEIRSKSGKSWFFDLWGLKEVPAESMIVRVEFQLRREAIRSLGIDTFEDLLRLEGSLWAYCSQQWLRFEDRPGMHHTLRNLLPWWEEVQNGYRGAQGATPLIRGKAIDLDVRRTLGQLTGHLSSLIALMDAPGIRNDLTKFEDYPVELQRLLQAIGVDGEMLVDKAVDKIAKFHRSEMKWKAVQAERARLGLAGAEGS